MYSNKDDVMLLRVQVQLMFPLVGILRALWKYQYSTHLPGSPRLLTAMYHRLNAHEGYVDYCYTYSDQRRIDDEPIPSLQLADTRFQIENSSRRQLREQKRNDYLTSLSAAKLLQKKRTNNWTNKGTNISQINDRSAGLVSNIFFWQSLPWWLEQRVDQWFLRGGKNQSRTARLLNMLVRTMATKGVVETDKAVSVLRNANERQIDILHKLYIEPAASSLFAAYLSTIFMHHKQQHGLNTKHAAGVGSSSSVSSKHEQLFSSANNFDQKIYLDMCSSCDKKEIFELMLKLPREHHQQTPCLCTTCRTLTEMANAWCFYDCTDCSWLRLEFNRRLYSTVTALLADRINDQQLSIVFFSYKNEFHEKEKFIANFVNYYAFYENNERPVNCSDVWGPLREKISIIFVFAVVNWRLIESAISAKKMHNSISLNQQSMFKSLDNTLYAIFSENSINRMTKETEQRVLDINAPYINRGFGSLPNCGVNAFTTTVCEKINVQK